MRVIFVRAFRCPSKTNKRKSHENEPSHQTLCETEGKLTKGGKWVVCYTIFCLVCLILSWVLIYPSEMWNFYIATCTTQHLGFLVLFCFVLFCFVLFCFWFVFFWREGEGGVGWGIWLFVFLFPLFFLEGWVGGLLSLIQRTNWNNLYFVKIYKWIGQQAKPI